MNISTTTGFAAVLSLGLALPLAAQEPQDNADTDGDGFVSSEEASAHSEKRFDEIADGADTISMDDFHASMIGTDPVSAEAETPSDTEVGFGEADADADGALSREEWTKWREVRFEEAAGAEGRVEAGLYTSIDAGGPMAGVDEGGGSVAPDAPAEDSGG